MKKLLFSFVVLPGALAMAQVGVNTNQPDGSFDVAYIKGAEGTKWGPETPQGVHFPNVSTEQRSKFKNVREGMIIYNTNKKCLEMYLVPESGAPQWECILNVGSEASQGVAVSPESSSGRFAEGVPFTEENTVSFTITNNGFSPITANFSDAVTVENEGITVDGSANNSVSLKAGESKTLTYKLSGTPKAGQLRANFSKLGLSAEQVLTVGKGIADLQDQEYYVLSFTYNNIKKGYIDNTSNQISLKIPYTNGKGSYDAVSITQTIADGQGGDTKQITLSISEGKFSQTGELIATLNVEGDKRYQVKQLAPGESYDIATYNININGSTSRVIIKGIGVIPDRNYGKETNGQLRHQFVYLPVTVKGAKGYNKTWLNYNLGAEYAKETNFKPQQQLFGTDAHGDDKTYGSLYQWQRASDGHEFRNSEPTTDLADTWKSTGKAAKKFVNRNLNNWVKNGESASGPDLELWSAKGDNNPCPSGYHVPTAGEWRDLFNAVGSNNNMWSQNKLPNLAAAGYRSGSNPIPGGKGANYWSSTNSSNSQAQSTGFSDKGNNPNLHLGRAYGFSVRCIKSK
ncbi:fibrobacter succinogenes major paralogous domain [Candidatus Ornithobacterium hominis]|uniref:Fibrobacter succinogenes major paralogous domain n=1 Tax=Candidatus Ornithobacterium hominis TaxID=2497989 RepID=A0A383TUN6_9FLAO|nr:FISUMP domain-containing protein [Candidatus Ornithobacterium hominis]MCT7904378.1 fibrobacter succinogenes major paralogous domain-containing protein [Candidatus Ornithobacterium hominis]SZD71275.1 fibrobacter succinogenes major paralogous domain [Candidatus Ornithobacterium hominis]